MKPNVLLAVLDSVRWANTSLDDHYHDTTPFLARFADSTGSLYTEARAPSIWSLPSHVSMFTGLHVVEHGIVDVDHRLAGGHTFWEALEDDHGYSTAVFSPNEYLTAVPVGLEDAFSTVEGRPDVPFDEGLNPRNVARNSESNPFVSFFVRSLQAEHTVASLLNGISSFVGEQFPSLLPEALDPTAPSSLYVDRFLDWQSHQEGPWAACLNFMDAHSPYLPTAEHDRWGGPRLRELQRDIDHHVWEFVAGDRPWWQRRSLEALYDGAIRQMDAELARLVDSLKERGAFEETLLVVTSDHGEGFGEQSPLRPTVRVAEHNYGLHESLLHVPLVVKYPGGTGPETTGDVVSLTRLADVVTAVIDGRDGHEALTDDNVVVASSYERSIVEEYAGEYGYERDAVGGDAHAVYENDRDAVKRRAIWGKDAGETTIRDHATRPLDPDERTELRERIAGFQRRDVQSEYDLEDIGTETYRRLQDLGYV